MIEMDIEIINKLGLHARAAAKLVGVAAQFQSSVRLGRSGRLVDAKSIMALLMLGAGKGTILHIVIDGSDEAAARAAVTTLITNRFDEAE